MKYKLWPSTKIMKFSTIAFIVVIILGLLSMGFLGSGLFMVASPILQILIPGVASDLNTISGDWVWPAMIGVPILWSFGFLIAARVYQYQETLDWTQLTMKTSYVAILLIWNLVIWLFLLLNITA